MDFKKNSPLIIGMTIPVLMILFVAGSIYLPGFFADPPTYDFIYISGNDFYYCDYQVRGNKLVRVDRPDYVVKDPATPPCNPIFRQYDAETDTSKEIAMEDVEKLKLDSNRVSPDGYEVARGGGGGGFFIFDGGSNYNNVYLRGHNWSKRINIGNNGTNYYYDFRFIGWILP